MKYLPTKIRETIKKALGGDKAAQEAAQRAIEAEFSYSDTHKALYATLKGGYENGVYMWRYIVDVFAKSENSGWLVYEEEKSGSDALFRADYTINDAGEATVTNPQKVKIAYELLPVEISESARHNVRETTFVSSISETQASSDGTIEICIIKAGDGSSGHYTREVLERDIPKIFPVGTQMFANHLSAEEEENQPEGRIEFLAAETTTAPVWKSGAVGEGMYCRCKTFSDWAPMLKEKARSIGVSISAWGVGEFKDSGFEFTQLTEGRSIDFVTKAGAGGAIVSINEARRSNSQKSTTPPTTSQETNSNMNHEEEVQLREAAGKTAALEAENKRLKEAAISREAKDLATVVLADIEMPDAMRARITESAKPVLSETGALDVEAFKTAVTEAAAQELEYFQSMGYGDGKVRGHGANAQEKHRENSLDGVQNVREAAGL